MAPRAQRRGSYFDQTTQIRYETNDADYEGFLYKQSAWIKEWRKRYFVLKGSKLFFAKTISETPHGMIDLATCMTVKSAELKAQKRHALEVSTPDTQFLMYAEDEKQKDDWIGAIGRAIVQSSNTYTTEDNQTPGMGDEDSDSDDDGSINEDY